MDGFKLFHLEISFAGIMKPLHLVWNLLWTRLILFNFQFRVIKLTLLLRKYLLTFIIFIDMIHQCLCVNFLSFFIFRNFHNFENVFSFINTVGQLS